MNTRDFSIYMAKRGLSLSDVAQALGITEKTLYNYRKNERFPKWFSLSLGLSKLIVVNVNCKEGESVRRILTCADNADVIGGELGLTVTDGDQKSFVGYDADGSYFSVSVERE